MRRQDPPRWGRDYLPAIKATVAEGSRVSRLGYLRSRRLGRYVQLQSLPERYAAVLALYHPQLRDLLEQRMLWTGPAAHPLSTYPGACLSGLPSSRGTLRIAEEFGCRGDHPHVPHGDGWVVLPYIGDLLLVMEDETGLYCINWTVKKRNEDFEKPFRENRRFCGSSEEAIEKVVNRHRIEAAYYDDFGIRTERVTEEQIDLILARNLFRLLAWDARELHVNEEARHELLDAVRQAVHQEIALPSLLIRFQQKRGWSQQTVLGAVYQAIWKRELLIDLFRPLLIDRPLMAEVRNPLQEYHHWFRR